MIGRAPVVFPISSFEKDLRDLLTARKPECCVAPQSRAPLLGDWSCPGKPVPAAPAITPAPAGSTAGRSVIFDRARHFLQDDRGPEIADAVLAFLGRTVGARL